LPDNVRAERGKPVAGKVEIAEWRDDHRSGFDHGVSI